MAPLWIVQRPETVGSGSQLFQTLTVHRSPATKTTLSEEHLVSVCAGNDHVRTRTVARSRGMIPTQPGSAPLASFQVSSLEETVMWALRPDPTPGLRPESRAHHR